MKNLAEFKRALKPGTKWRYTVHRAFDGRNPDGSSKYRVLPAIVQSVVRCSGQQAVFEKPNGDYSYLQFGLAGEWKFEPGKAFWYDPYDNNKLMISYEQEGE